MPLVLAPWFGLVTRCPNSRLSLFGIAATASAAASMACARRFAPWAGECGRLSPLPVGIGDVTSRFLSIERSRPRARSREQSRTGALAEGAPSISSHRDFKELSSQWRRERWSVPRRRSDSTTAASAWQSEISNSQSPIPTRSPPASAGNTPGPSSQCAGRGSCPPVPGRRRESGHARD